MITSRLLRTQESQGRVGPIELLFDLVYVFTIIQLSHYVVYHLTVTGIAEAAVLFLAVWWGWNYTAWAMNWLEPDSRAVQLLVAVLMVAALCMAVAIPSGFGDRAAVFVAGYLVLQLLRSAVMVHAFRGQTMARNYALLLTWSAAAGVLWLVGLAVDDGLRLAIWAAAVLVDYAAPRVGFRVPGVGSAPMHTWPLTESHLAERNRLVFVIALGESILILGGVLLGLEVTAVLLIGALGGFLTMFLLWWLYFDYRQGNAEHEVADGVVVTALARGAYAYAHALMVAGAILVAVGIEVVARQPTGATGPLVAFAILAGPALYLLGNLAFQHALWGRRATSRLVGLTLLAMAALTALWLPPVGLAWVATAVLIGLAVHDARHDPERPRSAPTG